MATIALKGNKIKTIGELPKVGDKAPDFEMVKTDLSVSTLSDYLGSKILLNIFPSIDTGICATSVRKFNEEASKLSQTKVLCISRDLPFAQNKFCGAEGIQNVVSLSDFKNGKFGKDYGLEIAEGSFKGLHSRVVIVLDSNGFVRYTEQVPEIAQEPDYDTALSYLK